MFRELRQLLLIIAGTVLIAIGIVGIVIPILPTTPFLLLAAICYLHSSARFYRWLLHNRVFGTYVRNYIEGRGMATSAKALTIALLWLGIGFSTWLATENTIIRLLLVLIAIGVTLHIMLINEKKDEQENGLSNKDIFDKIAPSWYNFRHHTIFRKELETMVRRWKQGRLLNIGCGHGPDFLPFRESFELHGIDFSPGMLEMAQRYAAKFKFTASLVEADAFHLPYTDNYFDWAIAVATYHHIKGTEERVQAFRELFRVLRPGGEVFITVWNRWQPRFWFKPKNVLVPWRSRQETFYRYYYIFSSRELHKLVQQAGFKVLTVSPTNRGKFPWKLFSQNIILLLRK